MLTLGDGEETVEEDEEGSTSEGLEFEDGGVEGDGGRARAEDVRI